MKTESIGNEIGPLQASRQDIRLAIPIEFLFTSLDIEVGSLDSGVVIRALFQRHRRKAAASRTSEQVLETF